MPSVKDFLKNRNRDDDRDDDRDRGRGRDDDDDRDSDRGRGGRSTRDDDDRGGRDRERDRDRDDDRGRSRGRDDDRDRDRGRDDDRGRSRGRDEEDDDRGGRGSERNYNPRAGRFAGMRSAGARYPLIEESDSILELIKTYESAPPGKASYFHADFVVLASDVYDVGQKVSILHGTDGKSMGATGPRITSLVRAASGFDNDEEFEAEIPKASKSGKAEYDVLIDASLGEQKGEKEFGKNPLAGSIVRCIATKGRYDERKKTQYHEYDWSPSSKKEADRFESKPRGRGRDRDDDDRDRDRGRDRDREDDREPESDRRGSRSRDREDDRDRDRGRDRDDDRGRDRGRDRDDDRDRDRYDRRDRD